jgi:ribosome maturation factor RimP
MVGLEPFNGAGREEMKRGVPEVERELESRVDGLGFDLVEALWAGSRARPILRLRIDVKAAGEGRVTVADCAKVSRALEAWLDELGVMPERYVLEVSSPGVERPLTRPGDWQRFAGEWVAVTGHEVLAGRAKRLEGELVGVRSDESQSERIVIRLAGGDEVEIPRGEILRGQLVFRWK